LFQADSSDSAEPTPRFALAYCCQANPQKEARMNFAMTYPVCLAVGACLSASAPVRAPSDGQTTDAEKEMTMTLTKEAAPAGGQVALAATWEAKEGEAEAVARILRRMADAVKSEPGTLLFWPHRSSSNERVFFLYELFADDAAFAAHQQTVHFKRLVVGEALPKLARRERVQFMPLRPEANAPSFAD
jgi:quinol monooxygenase YgiN